MTSARKNLTVISEQLWQIILPPSSNALPNAIVSLAVCVCVCWVCVGVCVGAFDDTLISERICSCPGVPG